MDERIFDQLDQLQRGARELVPRQQGNNYSSAGYSDYGEADAYHDDCGTYFDEGERFANENVDLMVYSREEAKHVGMHAQCTDRHAGAHSQMPHTGYLPRHGAMNGTQGASWPSRPDTDRQAGNVTATTRSLDLCEFSSVKQFLKWSDTVQLASPLVMVPHQALLASSSRSTRVQYPEPARGDYNLPT